MKFKVGQKVRIKGDPSDSTDHLDGKIGFIERVGERDCRVYVPCDDNGYWYIWNYNMEVVEK